MDRPGVQGGTIPIKIGPIAVTDPYGHANDEYQAEPGFADYLTSAMGQLMTRFEGSRKHFRERRNGGIGAFTPDNVPIFDWITPNVYMIADSNHGFKMTGAGKLVAKQLGERQRRSRTCSRSPSTASPRAGRSARATATAHGYERAGPSQARTAPPGTARSAGAHPSAPGRPKRDPSMGRRTGGKRKGLVEWLADGPVICAEGYLFELERRGYVQAGAFVPEAVLDHPEVVAQVHRDFVHAGSDVVEAFTYYAHREKLRIVGREHQLEAMNRQALAIAKAVAAETGALFAGDICNTNVSTRGAT